jgi:hypothetical protein
MSPDYRSIFNLKIVKQFLIGAFFPIFLLSCLSPEKVEFGGEEIPYYRISGTSDLFLEIDSLENRDVIFSGSGIWKIFNGQIILADKRTGVIHVFSDDLSLMDTRVGIGDGPNQTNGGIIAMASGNEGLFLLGGSYDYYLMDKDWTISKRGTLDFYHQETSYDELLKNPKPEYAGIYELHYEYQEPKWHQDGNVILQISSTHPEYNYILNQDYFKEARNLGTLDLNTGKVQITGSYPPIYSGSDFIPYLMGTAIETFQDNSFIQSFEADSLLYRFSAEGMIQYAFGQAGQNMITDYPSLMAMDVTEFDLGREEFRTKVNYYTTLDFIEERDLLVRGYRKNSQTEDGIQLYRNDTLILDQAVPKGFEYFGYKEPYMYGSYNKQFEKEEKIVVYRIKLPE